MLRLISRLVEEEELANNFRTDAARERLQVSMVTEF
jgi:hypothetical protein